MVGRRYEPAAVQLCGRLVSFGGSTADYNRDPSGLTTSVQSYAHGDGWRPFP